MARRFVALDRDGTLIVERHYLSDPGRVELLPGVGPGLRRLRALGFGIIIVTNQSGLGRGYFDQVQLTLVHRRLSHLLMAEGVQVDGMYVCPHMPDDDCACRKPRPGLLEQAARDLHCDLPDSFIVGDKACDIGLGQRVGATTFLVRTGYGDQVAANPGVRPDYVVDGLWDVALVIERLTERTRISADAH